MHAVCLRLQSSGITDHGEIKHIHHPNDISQQIVNLKMGKGIKDNAFVFVFSCLRFNYFPTEIYAFYSPHIDQLFLIDITISKEMNSKDHKLNSCCLSNFLRDISNNPFQNGKQLQKEQETFFCSIKALFRKQSQMKAV